MKKEVIKRKREKSKPNRNKPQSEDDDDEDEEEEEPTNATKKTKKPKFEKYRAGELVVMSNKTELTWEVCVACYLDWKKKIIEDGEPVPEKLFRLFARCEIKSKSTLIRNHKNYCYSTLGSDKQCCDAEDARGLTLKIPWKREFAPNVEEVNREHAGY